MKIGIINTWAISNKAIGGTERFIMDIAQSFVKDGHEVDVYMFSGISHKQNGVNYININLFNIQGEADEYMIQNYFGDFRDYDSYSKLAKEMESKIDIEKYDFIQLNSLIFLEAWKDKKRIFTIHTNPYEYELAWGEESYVQMLNVMNKFSRNENTIFVAPSKFYANEYSRLTKCQVNYIPHAIEIDRIETQKNKIEILQHYNLNKDKIKIIVPSRLEPIQKQPMLLLDACCQLNAEQKKKIQIVFTGLDKQYEKFVGELEDKAKENNIDVKILRVDNMAEAYKIADLTILPSRSESFGYSALESLSLGIYTILNDIPTFNEIANGNNYNYIFKNDCHELSNKIAELLDENKCFHREKPSPLWQKRYNITTFEKSYINLLK